MTALSRLDADQVSQPPEPRFLEEPCGACDQARCIPVASVAYTDRSFGDSTVAVGLVCLPSTVDYANDRSPEGKLPVVAFSVWDLPSLAHTAGIGERRAGHWLRLGLVVPMDGSRSAYPHRFLAPEVEHARWLARCSRAGLNLQRAHELLVGSDADRAMAQAFHARFASRGAVAA